MEKSAYARMKENVSYFADKARITQNKCRVNLVFFSFKACAWSLPAADKAQARLHV